MPQIVDKRALAGREVIVVESESGIGAGVNSRNSEVIPAGICYRTGVDKTLVCVEGKAMLYAFCQEFRVPHKRIAFGASGVQGHFRRGERRFRRTYQLPNRRCSTRADTRGARVDRRRQRGPFDPHWTTIRPVSKRASTSRTTAWRMLLISKSFGV